MKKIIRIFLILFINTCLINLATAQDTVLNVLNRGKLDSLSSAILNQKRFIEVFTPSDYKPGSNEKYDVLYVLDGGNWNTGMISKIQNFVEGQGYMPPTIIVSVMGIDRNKDLTPTRIDGWKTSGGGENFLAFIKDELMPYVNKNYPSNGQNTLWGHSLGGLFVMYALLKEPASFTSYIAVDPSFWWDNRYLPKMAASKLPALGVNNTTLFISGREGPDFKEMGIDTMELILKKYAPSNLIWKLVAYPGETHSSVRLKTTYDGLKFSYDGLTAGIQFHPMNGILLKDRPIKIWYFDDTTRMNYTIDGSLPTTISPQVRHEINLSGETKLTYRKFSNRSHYDKMATGNFRIEKMPAPLTKPKDVKKGGFNYAYYEGDFDKWPVIKNLKPVKTGITDKNFDTDSLPRKNNYALVIDGFLESKEEGYYIFLLEADTDSKLYLGDRLLMQWEGNYNNRTYSYIVPLSKGFYPFRIEYLHKKEDFKLRWTYLTPSGIETKNPVPIPLDLQYSR